MMRMYVMLLIMNLGDLEVCVCVCVFCFIALCNAMDQNQSGFMYA